MTTNSKSRSWVSRGYKPYAIVDGYELISYPWSEHGIVKVNAREPGDPTTLGTFIIDDLTGELTNDWETCECCHKAKPDVYERPDGYRQDINNEPDAVWTACDNCNSDNNDSI
jgi:hypothetical protein